MSISNRVHYGYFGTIVVQNHVDILLNPACDLNLLPCSSGSPRLPDGDPERAGQALEVGDGVGRGLVARGAAPTQIGEPVEQAPGRVLGEPQVDTAPHPGRGLGGARDRVERAAVERAVGG